MNTDSFLRIGSSHHTCQDYVFEYSQGVALSDGCSSAKHSDVGARLVCHAMLAGNLENLPQVLDMLKLDTSCLFATYINIKHEQDKLLFTRYGDGSIVLGMNTGKVLITEYSFGANMPYYPAYKVLGLDKDFNEASSASYNWITIKAFVFNPDFSLDINPPPVIRGREFEVNTPVNLENVIWAAILSDGLSSFIDNQNNAVSIEQVAKELFSFKNYNGEFVKRRMRAAFKEFDKRGWKNTDDFSIGVIHNG